MAGNPAGSYLCQQSAGRTCSILEDRFPPSHTFGQIHRGNLVVASRTADNPEDSNFHRSLWARTGSIVESNFLLECIAARNFEDIRPVFRTGCTRKDIPVS